MRRTAAAASISSSMLTAGTLAALEKAARARASTLHSLHTNRVHCGGSVALLVASPAEVLSGDALRWHSTEHRLKKHARV
jgi:hypothetical protein